MHHRAVSEFDALPAIVAIHGVISSNQRRDLSHSKLAHLLLKLLHKVASAVRRGLASIHEAVHENTFHFLPLRHFEQRKKMLNVRMDAAIAQQSEKMKLPQPPALHRFLKQQHLVQLPVGHHQINFCDVHVHNAPGAHVQVPHFAVSHLTLRKSHRRPRSLNQRVWKILDQPVVGRLARKSNRVSLRFRSVAPAIKHSQHNRFRSFGHFSSRLKLRSVSSIPILWAGIGTGVRKRILLSGTKRKWNERSTYSFTFYGFHRDLGNPTKRARTLKNLSSQRVNGRL